jgi:hypothetical protein
LILRVVGIMLFGNAADAAGRLIDDMHGVVSGALALELPAMASAIAEGAAEADDEVQGAELELGA